MATVLLATGPVLPLEFTSRAGDWLGLQGELWWLPRIRSPCFEREPKASSPHTSKGKPQCSSPGSSFSAGNSESCLGPGCGMGWDGSPHTCPPKPRSCSKAPLSAQKPLCAPLTLSWATQGEGRSSLQRDRGSCSERLLPCTGSPRDTQTSSPLPPHPQGDLCWRDFMFQTRFSFLTPPFQPRASSAPALLLPHVQEHFNHPCMAKMGRTNPNS